MKLLLLTLLICLPLTTFAQDPEDRERQQKDFFKEFSTEAYDQIDEQLELEEEIPTHCPKCKVKLNKVPIVYGLPEDKLMERARRGEVILGGCVAYEGRPNFAFVCPKCKEVIGKYFIEDEQSKVKEQFE